MSLVTKFFDLLGLTKAEPVPYWLKITTKVPQCVYFFGPFDSPIEAKALQAGYIEDLIQENAQGIHIELQHCSQPPQLTICEEDEFF